MIKKMKNDKDVFIEKRGDMIISIDFGHKDDVAVETIFRKDKNGLTIISGRYHKATVEELIEHFKGKEK